MRRGSRAERRCWPGRSHSDSPITQYGKTPLHIASRYGRVRIVEALLGKGASVEARNEVGPPLARTGPKTRRRLRIGSDAAGAA